MADRQGGQDGDAEVVEVSGRAHATQHQQLRRVEGPTGHDHLLPGPHHTRPSLPDELDPVGPLGPRLDENLHHVGPPVSISISTISIPEEVVQQGSRAQDPALGYRHRLVHGGREGHGAVVVLG